MLLFVFQSTFILHQQPFSGEKHMSATARETALGDIAASQPVPPFERQDSVRESASADFGCDVFSARVMRERLPRDVYKRLRETMSRRAPLNPADADVIASAMKDWAIERGATHYTHWFQPMTGLTAEKTRRVPRADAGRPGFERVFGKNVDSRRAGRVLLPFGRHPLHV